MTSKYKVLEQLDNKVVLDVDDVKGINQPGVVSGTTYRDSDGKLVHKYITTTVYSKGHVDYLKAKAAKAAAATPPAAAATPEPVEELADPDAVP